MAEHEVKLTKLAKCAGCGAKVGAGVLSQLLEGIQTGCAHPHHDHGRHCHDHGEHDCHHGHEEHTCCHGEGRDGHCHHDHDSH